jgi:uncharacterized protein (DUF983 family)
MLGSGRGRNKVKKCPRCGRSNVKLEDEYYLLKPICVECRAELALEILRAEQSARNFWEQWSGYTEEE